MDLQIQSNSIFWEHFKKAIAKKLIKIYCFLIELQKDPSWIDKIQQLTICQLRLNCIMLSKQSN